MTSVPAQKAAGKSISVALTPSIRRTVSILYLLCAATSHVLTMFWKATGLERVGFHIFFSVTIITTYKFSSAGSGCAGPGGKKGCPNGKSQLSVSDQAGDGQQCNKNRCKVYCCDN